jgi:hypothetical protein
MTVDAELITRMIDINCHLITATGHPPPSDYHASFLNLARISIILRLSAIAGPFLF